MSRGPGKIERALHALLASEPDGAFTIRELCERVYQVAQVEKKHRVSVLNALKRSAPPNSNWVLFRANVAGSPLVLCNHDSAMSRALGRAKCYADDEQPDPEPIVPPDWAPFGMSGDNSSDMRNHALACRQLCLADLQYRELRAEMRALRKQMRERRNEVCRELDEAFWAPVHNQVRANQRKKDAEQAWPPLPSGDVVSGWNSTPASPEPESRRNPIS
jgi:hypothetical protein